MPGIEYVMLIIDVQRSILPWSFLEIAFEQVALSVEFEEVAFEQINHFGLGGLNLRMGIYP